MAPREWAAPFSAAKASELSLDELAARTMHSLHNVHYRESSGGCEFVELR